MNLGYVLSATAMCIGAFAWLAGLLFGIFQCILWLRDGYWTHFTPVLILGPVQSTGWGGVDQIVHWIWLQPLWGVIGCLGVAVAALGIVAGQAYE